MSGFFDQGSVQGYRTLPPTDAPTTALPTCAPFGFQTEPPTPAPYELQTLPPFVGFHTLPASCAPFGFQTEPPSPAPYELQTLPPFVGYHTLPPFVGYHTLPPFVGYHTTTAPFTCPPEDFGAVSKVIELGHLISVTPGATPHVKTGYTEIIASTAEAYQGIMIYLAEYTAGSSLCYNVLADLAFGAGGSESIKVGNLLFACDSTVIRGEGILYIPLHIPAGTRLSIAAQAGKASVSLAFCIHGVVHLGATFDTITTYGATTASSSGVIVDPGASANNKGNWAALGNLAAATYWLAWVLGNENRLQGNNYTNKYDIGVGAGPTVFIGNMPAEKRLSINTRPLRNALCVNRVNNEAISARAESTGTTAADRKLELILYGASSPA